MWHDYVLCGSKQELISVVSPCFQTHVGSLRRLHELGAVASQTVETKHKVLSSRHIGQRKHRRFTDPNNEAISPSGSPLVLELSARVLHEQEALEAAGRCGSAADGARQLAFAVATGELIFSC